MEKLYIILTFCALAIPKGTVGAAAVNNSEPVSFVAASSPYNNPSDNEVKCSEYNNGECYLYVYTNKTHPRFLPVSSNSSNITRVSVSGRLPLLTDDICNEFPNLEELQLAYLSIEEILPGAFDKCRKAKTIYLYQNNIRELSKDTFRYNFALERLSLYNNRLRELNQWLFASLFNLQYLHLYNNYLSEFPSELVKTNKELNTLNLYKNDILDLDEVKLAENAPKLKYLYINNNQLSCDRLEQIRSYLQASGVYLSDSTYTTYRKRYYLQDTIDNFLCLSTETWLNIYNQQRALQKRDSTVKFSVSGIKQ